MNIQIVIIKETEEEKVVHGNFFCTCVTRENTEEVLKDIEKYSKSVMWPGEELPTSYNPFNGYKKHRNRTDISPDKIYLHCKDKALSWDTCVAEGYHKVDNRCFIHII